MAQYLIKRILLAIPVLFVTALLVFSALHFSRGDPVSMVVGQTAPQWVREEARIRLGLDKPFHIQFSIYVKNILKGDLGRSILSRRPVMDLILEKLPVTAELGVAAFVITYLFAIPLGALAALKRSTFYDWSSMVVALIGVSMPGFWLGLILMFIFSVNFGLLPPTGYGSLKTLILPALALGLPRVGRIARITRSTLLEVIHEDYVRTARAKGVPEMRVILRHALRNALIPIISWMGLDLGYIVGGSVVIERVFARSGVGNLMLSAIKSRDFPVLQGCMFVLSFAIILGNIFAEAAYVVVDPRIRHEIQA